ncbi:hypothetical protein B7Y94_06130 [Candidatus Saccharibacteria bacterium 32-49-12]|nr:MAG: hypothetical protein B7Y94_06130 [Candidatus Saccharibacteria bacterium 32-49-12]
MVIGILAAISIVAYNGVSNKAHDTAVKNDLANFAKKVQMIHAETGEYPAGGMVDPGGGAPTSGAYFSFPGFTFQPSKVAYSQPPDGSGAINVVYCTGPELSSGDPGFRILAKSSSGKNLRYTSAQGVESASVGSITRTLACSGLGFPQSFSYGYGATSKWAAWTN